MDPLWPLSPLSGCSDRNLRQGYALPLSSVYQIGVGNIIDQVHELKGACAPFFSEW